MIRRVKKKSSRFKTFKEVLLNVSYVAQILMVIVTYWIYADTVKPLIEILQLKNQIANLSEEYQKANDLNLLSFKNEISDCWNKTFRPPYSMENRFEREMVHKLTQCMHSKLNTSLYFAALKESDKEIIVKKLINVLTTIENSGNERFNVFEDNIEVIQKKKYDDKYGKENDFLRAIEKCSNEIYLIFINEIEKIKFDKEENFSARAKRSVSQ